MNSRPYQGERNPSFNRRHSVLNFWSELVQRDPDDLSVVHQMLVLEFLVSLHFLGLEAVARMPCVPC